MGISIFPSTASEFVSNNFVIDMNDSTNNTADTGGIKQAGPYSMSFSSGDTSFDVYFIDEDGNSVGYSNTTSIEATGLFSTVVIFGVAQDEVISFNYQGSVNNADGEGDEPGAGAYLESITPSDLPGIDDTATVVGGNFGASTVFTFESGATVLNAKNASIVSGTEALITRPDELIEDDAPYDLKAVNPGVPTPTTKDFVLTDAVTAGSDPTWVTTSPLNAGSPGVSFSQTLEATDADGTVVDYSVTAGTITAGLTLDSSTGVLSGTPTTGGNFTFTVTATDDGGNTTAKQFEHPIQLASGGTISDSGGFRTHTFNSTDDFIAFVDIANAEIKIIAGGGGGGDATGAGPGGAAGGGGGAGGFITQTQTITAGTITATVGGGGSVSGNGSNSAFGAIGTAIGGGAGGSRGSLDGKSGGSGGGGAQNRDQDIIGTGGSGTAGQGNDGGTPLSGGNPAAGGGGGASAVGQTGPNSSTGGDGGAGLDSLAGGAGGGGSPGGDGTAGGGDGSDAGGANATSGQPNTGGGGGGGLEKTFSGFNDPAAGGGSGVVIVRYAF